MNEDIAEMQITKVLMSRGITMEWEQNGKLFAGGLTLRFPAQVAVIQQQPHK